TRLPIWTPSERPEPFNDKPLTAMPPVVLWIGIRAAPVRLPLPPLELRPLQGLPFLLLLRREQIGEVLFGLLLQPLHLLLVDADSAVVLCRPRFLPPLLLL